MNKKLVFILVFYVSQIYLFGTKVAAQDPFEDTQSWTGISSDIKIVKRLKLLGAAQIRLSNNFGVLKSYVFKTGLRYKISSKFKVGIHYRYTVTPEIYNRSRVTLKGQYAEKIFKRTHLSVGLKYQTDFNQVKKFEEVVFLDDQLLRPKLKLKHKIKKRKIYPYTGVEGFYHLYYKGNQFEQVRFILGTEFALSKHHSLDFTYIRSWEMNVRNLLNRHIVAFNYHYSF